MTRVEPSDSADSAAALSRKVWYEPDRKLPLSPNKRIIILHSDHNE
jgi:hypothetical protein